MVFIMKNIPPFAALFIVIISVTLSTSGVAAANENDATVAITINHDDNQHPPFWQIRFSNWLSEPIGLPFVQQAYTTFTEELSAVTSSFPMVKFYHYRQEHGWSGRDGGFFSWGSSSSSKPYDTTSSSLYIDESKMIDPNWHYPAAVASTKSRKSSLTGTAPLVKNSIISPKNHIHSTGTGIATSKRSDSLVGDYIDRLRNSQTMQKFLRRFASSRPPPRAAAGGGTVAPSETDHRPWSHYYALIGESQETHHDLINAASTATVSAVTAADVDRYIRLQAYREATATLILAETLARETAAKTKKLAEDEDHSKVKDAGSLTTASTTTRLRGGMQQRRTNTPTTTTTATTTKTVRASVAGPDTVRLYFYNALVSADDILSNTKKANTHDSRRTHDKKSLPSSSHASEKKVHTSSSLSSSSSSSSSLLRGGHYIVTDEKQLRRQEEDDEQDEAEEGGSGVAAVTAVENPVVVFGYSIDDGQTYRFLNAISLKNYILVNDVPRVGTILYGFTVYSAAEFEALPSPIPLQRNSRGEDEIVFERTGIAAVKCTDTAVAIIAMYEGEEEEEEGSASVGDDANNIDRVVRFVSRQI